MNNASRTQATPTTRIQRLPDPSGLASFRFYQAARLWQQCLGSALKPLGLTPTQFGLLFHIAWLLQGGGEPVSQVVLAHATHHDVMTVSQVLRALEKKRLVTRLSHPSDPRANATFLTATGAKTTARAFQLALRAKNEFFGALGSEEPELRRMLDTLISSRLETPAGSVS
jgi:DNA-binding MarR family transcriptional regulator